MDTRTTAIVCAAALAATAAVPAASAKPPSDMKELTRIASRLSGIAPRRPVRADVVSKAALERHALRLLDRGYPRANQAYDEGLYRALGLLAPGQALRPELVRRHVRGVKGVYDSGTRRVYVRAGTRMRTELLRQIVYALQDQAFNLRRLNGLRGGSRDAALAARGAVDGTAAFSSVQDVRSLASHGGSRLRLFLDLEDAFASTTGARFASTLHHVGGRRAVFDALRRFPATTEQVFHVDAFLERAQPLPVVLPQQAAGLELAADDTFGELDVRALLAVYQVPRLDHVGEGWGGGRSALYRDGAGRSAYALVLEWDTEGDASEWAEAVETYMNEAFDAGRPARPPPVGCAADACWNPNGRHPVAFVRRATASALVFGPSVEAGAALAGALVGRWAQPPISTSTRD